MQSPRLHAAPSSFPWPPLSSPAARRCVVFGAGQIGRQVARSLAAAGHTVRVVRRSAVSPGPGIEVLAGDARDADFAVSAAAGADVVLHCMNPSAYTAQVWEEELPRLQDAVVAAALRARPGGARLVVLDNLYGYGDVAGPRHADDAMRATGRKGKLRAAWAKQLERARAAQGLRFVVGRAGDFFGPGAEQALFSDDVVAGLLRGKRPWLLGHPSQPHAFGYVPDVVSALCALALADDDVEGRAYLLPALTVAPASLLQAVNEALGVDVKPQRGSRLLLLALSPFVPLFGELRETLYQWERPFLVDDAPFRARFPGVGTALADAVRATAAAGRERAASGAV